MTPTEQSPPPASVCVLRLSAIGDVCHTLPVVRTIQDAWPGTPVTWILGRVEHKLVGHLPDVEFVVFDKRAGLAGYRDLRQRLSGRRFDVLLHMQLALRASVAAALVPAPVKVGFDRARAREGQWLFTNRRIAARGREHVLDGLFGFAEAIGLGRRSMRWNIPLPEAARAEGRRAVPDDAPTLVLSPCSSHALRNWGPDRYAALADHAVARHRLRVIVCGGPTDLERETGARIAAAMHHPCDNLVGQDTLPGLLATLARATVLVSPDSGPAHMATAVGTPVVGLYAATNPARSGPYYSRAWCVDRYPEAARHFLGREPGEIPWTTKIERPGVMDLVTLDDAVERLDALMAAGAPRTPCG
ncbi:MAG: glycosyltransferase family 9 protein [Steroidobacteraceae bacterium]